MNKKIILISILLAFSFIINKQSWSQPYNRINLKFSEAYDRMNANNHTLKQADLYIKEKSEEVKATEGLRFPNINIAGNGALMADRIHLDLSQVRDAILPLYQTLGAYGNFSGVPNPDPSTNQIMPTLPDAISTSAVRSKLLGAAEEIKKANWDQTIQDKRFASLSANIIWPVYAGGKINAANKASRLSKDEAVLKKEQTKAELLSELATRYFGLVLAKEAENVRKEVFDGMGKHLSDAKKMVEQGQIAHVEELHAQVAYADAESELKKAVRQTTIVHKALQNTLALAETDSVITITSLFIPVKIEDEDYFIELANKNSPLLKQIDTKKEMAKIGVQVKKSDYLPTVALAGTYDIADKDLSPYLPDWAAGLNVSWTLFDGLSRYRKLQAAKSQLGQVEQAEAKANDDIATAVHKLYEEMKMEEEQIKSKDKSLEFAKAYTESQEKAFKEGISKSADLVDARLLLAKTKIERLQDLYQYDVVLATLLQICGTPDDFPKYINEK
jgi:outer membrane protein TolC